jgi:hypothetical protein
MLKRRFLNSIISLGMFISGFCIAGYVEGLLIQISLSIAIPVVGAIAGFTLEAPSGSTANPSEGLDGRSFVAAASSINPSDAAVAA